MTANNSAIAGLEATARLVTSDVRRMASSVTKKYRRPAVLATRLELSTIKHQSRKDLNVKPGSIASLLIDDFNRELISASNFLEKLDNQINDAGIHFSPEQIKAIIEAALEPIDAFKDVS